MNLAAVVVVLLVLVTLCMALHQRQVTAAGAGGLPPSPPPNGFRPGSDYFGEFAGNGSVARNRILHSRYWGIPPPASLV